MGVRKHPLVSPRIALRSPFASEQSIEMCNYPVDISVIYIKSSGLRIL